MPSRDFHVVGVELKSSCIPVTHWVVFTPLRLGALSHRAERESSRPFGRVEFGGEPPSCPAYQAGQQFRVHNVDTSSEARGVFFEPALHGYPPQRHRASALCCGILPTMGDLIFISVRVIDPLLQAETSLIQLVRNLAVSRLTS